MIARSKLTSSGAVVAALVAATTFLFEGDGDGDAVPASATTPAAPFDGASLFTAKGCAACHRGPGASTASMGFPDLRRAATWSGSRVDGLTGAEYLAQSIRDPGAVVSPEFDRSGGEPAAAMPALGLAEEEIDAIVAYLLAGTSD